MILRCQKTINFVIKLLIVLKKIYYLKTCNTCTKILKYVNPSEDVELQEIKSIPLTNQQVEELKSLSGSFESLFNKRSQLYKKYDLKNKNLREDDFKSYLLEHYTFLKRPVIVVGKEVFIGNSKSTVEAAKKALNEL